MARWTPRSTRSWPPSRPISARRKPETHRHGSGTGPSANQIAKRSLFEEALLVWDASGPWIAALAPERRARSSTFHLRLEAKHPGGYQRHSRERYETLAAEGRAALIALRDQQPPPFDGPARWARDRPEGYSDGRELMAAVLLVAAYRG